MVYCIGDGEVSHMVGGPKPWKVGGPDPTDPPRKSDNVGLQLHCVIDLIHILDVCIRGGP